MIQITDLKTSNNKTCPWFCFTIIAAFQYKTVLWCEVVFRPVQLAAANNQPVSRLSGKRLMWRMVLCLRFFLFKHYSSLLIMKQEALGSFFKMEGWKREDQGIINQGNWDPGIQYVISLWAHAVFVSALCATDNRKKTPEAASVQVYKWTMVKVIRWICRQLLITR